MTNRSLDRERIEFWATALQSESFEDVLASLEEVLTTLESGNLPLAETIALYELGVRLNQRCQQILDDATLHIEEIDTIILGKADGSDESGMLRSDSFSAEVPF